MNIQYSIRDKDIKKGAKEKIRAAKVLMPNNDHPTINLAQLDCLFSYFPEAYLVDTCNTYRCIVSHLAGAILAAALENMQIDNATPLIVYSEFGDMSYQVVEQCIRKGYGAFDLGLLTTIRINFKELLMSARL